MRLAASRTFWTAGKSRPMRTAMMAMTTSSSINVKAESRRCGEDIATPPEKNGTTRNRGEGGELHLKMGLADHYTKKGKQRSLIAPLLSLPDQAPRHVKPPYHRSHNRRGGRGSSTSSISLPGRRS